MSQPLPAHIWPLTATIANGRLHLGGCDVEALAARYGTPLYVFDEATLRGAMRAYQAAFRAQGLPFRVHYAAKALLNTAIAQLVATEGLGLDVVSGAELDVARRAGIPMAHVHLHGNAKRTEELARAVAWGVGAVVVDNLDELDRLAALTARHTSPQGVLLRLAPNIAAHTHAHIATGGADAKFGLPLEALDQAVEHVLAAPGLRLRGLHAHIGSQLFALDQLRATMAVLVEQAARLRTRYALTVEELSPGGGLGVPSLAEQAPPDLDAYAEVLARTLRAGCAAHSLPLPYLTVEPGRSIVARAGVALYTIVARKLTADGRPCYLHIDGGMADNIRPALYDARYSAVLASRADAAPGPPVSVAGRYCEAGDVLLRAVSLPIARPGELLAVATAGAYTLSMASTYNLVPRPAVVLVAGGRARLIQRRETEAELLARDLRLDEVSDD
ncbi:MAG: diaminopimelate decarboxylase [Chloroflexi bacterium]|nr:diaminopimelate decarboxylase [Chloroflexota bacterium]